MRAEEATARADTEEDMEDRISALPEEVKHHILSLLPSITEVVGTSSLSKSWLQTWLSFQVCDFQFWFFVPDAVVCEVMKTSSWQWDCESFIRFVYCALTRSCALMPRFSLYTTPETAPHVDRLLGMALENRVEELSLYFLSHHFRPYILPDWVSYVPLPSLPYSIPGRVLNAEFIKSLEFTNVLVDARINPVTLPSLRSLTLRDCHIKQRMFRRLLKGCHLLEYLTVSSCHRLYGIQIMNLNHLKRVIITGSFSRLDVVSIKAPALEDLTFNCTIYRQEYPETVIESENLRWLNFGGKYVTDEWFIEFLSKFPLLEDLCLTGSRFWERIWILNPHLKYIVIENCNNMVDIRIETPELSYFCYDGQCDQDSMAVPLIRTMNPPFSCAVGFSFYFFSDLTATWFQELQKVFYGWSTTFGFSESVVHLYQVEGETLYEGSPNLSSPGIQHLLLKFTASESCYPDILDGLFSTCRPTTIYFIATYPFRKYICETLAGREESPRSSADAECWKHELKDVKIKGVKGLHGPLDWDSLFSLLPTLTSGDEVCFGLQW